MKWLLVVALLILCIEISLAKSKTKTKDSSHPIKKTSFHKPKKHPKSILDKFADLNDDDKHFLKELDKQFKAHGDKVKIKIEKGNATNTKNTKRTIEDSLGYGYQQHNQIQQGFYFAPPQFQVYPYSQQDIPPSSQQVKHYDYGKFNIEPSSSSLSPPTVHDDVEIQKSYSYEIKENNQNYGEFHQSQEDALSTKGLISPPLSGEQSDQSVPVIVLRIPGPAKYANHLQVLLQQYLELRAQQFLIELQGQEELKYKHQQLSEQQQSQRLNEQHRHHEYFENQQLIEQQQHHQQLLEKQKHQEQLQQQQFIEQQQLLDQQKHQEHHRQQQLFDQQQRHQQFYEQQQNLLQLQRQQQLERNQQQQHFAGPKYLPSSTPFIPITTPQPSYHNDYQHQIPSQVLPLEQTHQNINHHSIPFEHQQPPLPPNNQQHPHSDQNQPIQENYEPPPDSHPPTYNYFPQSNQNNEEHSPHIDYSTTEPTYTVSSGPAIHSGLDVQRIQSVHEEHSVQTVAVHNNQNHLDSQYGHPSNQGEYHNNDQEKQSQIQAYEESFPQSQNEDHPYEHSYSAYSNDPQSLPSTPAPQTTYQSNSPLTINNKPQPTHFNDHQSLSFNNPNPPTSNEPHPPAFQNEVSSPPFDNEPTSPPFHNGPPLSYHSEPSEPSFHNQPPAPSSDHSNDLSHTNEGPHSSPDNHESVSFIEIEENYPSDSHTQVILPDDQKPITPPSSNFNPDPRASPYHYHSRPPPPYLNGHPHLRRPHHPNRSPHPHRPPYNVPHGPRFNYPHQIEITPKPRRGPPYRYHSLPPPPPPPQFHHKRNAPPTPYTEDQFNKYDDLIYTVEGKSSIQ